ncbi:phosphatidylglycerophosphatase A [Legionella jordanis]|uniref:phosphatidylglycerophosphatase A family protein n=1 Tax=Legionella jordanis TaxID=456 RepID=UPI000EFE6BC8|nr:phosphatidylglycerophosphatase A [Legionella jordanis]RMX22032.1 phosphatidylglycerophosphatase A [Legionella jordanis]
MSMANLESRVWQNPIYFLAFGFGSGLMPVAPGTWGTLAAIPVYLLIAGEAVWLYLLLTLLAFLIGIWVCDKVSKDLGVHDYSGIVWDEVVGFLLTMTAVPLSAFWIIIGFLLFRLFDIWKPQPIRMIDQHVGGGLGIMLDDLLAAIPAWIILQLLVWAFNS